MAKLGLLLAFASVLILTPAAVYGTADPCFDFVCEDSVCGFDASCSTGLNPSTVWKIFWDFGDGTNNLGWTVAPTHQYNPICFPLVKLELWLWSGGKVTTSCFIHTGYPGCPGPPLPDAGRCN